MRTARVVVRCENGVHMRVAARVVKIAHAHQADVFLQLPGRPRVDGASILQVLTLGAAKDAHLDITTQGPEEEAALKALTELFEDGGGI